MKIWDRIIKGVNPDEEDHFNDIYEDDEVYSEPDGSGDLSDFMSVGGYNPSQYGNAPQNNQNLNPNLNNQNPGGFSPPPQGGYQQPPVVTPPAPAGGITMGGGNPQFSVELKVFKPQSYNDVGEIASNLINRKTIVLNLEETNKETIRRMIDFLAGVTFAVQGQLEKVAEKTFIITPSNVPITSDQTKDDIRRNSGRIDTNNIY